MPQPPPATPPRSRGLLLAVAYIGFVSLGLPDPVAGVAWPSVRDTFALPQGGFGLVFVALGVGYCASGFFGGKLAQVLGLGNLLWVSSGLVAVAMVGSGLAPVWPVFLACAVVWGLGSGGIDAGLNSYVSGHFSARHVNWLHACYGIGATLGPLLMAAMLVRAGSWRVGYHAVGGTLLGMTALFFATRRRWSEPPPSAQSAPVEVVGVKMALRSRLVRLQMVAFFLYVGLEFAVGQWSFTLFTESRGIRPEVAGGLTGGYYAAIGIGRLLAGAVARRVELGRLVRASVLLAIVGIALLAVDSPAEIGMTGLVLIGLGLAPVFPCLMAATPERLGGAYAAHAVGFQVSAGMLGAALVPGVAGLVAEAMGVERVVAFCGAFAVVLFLTHEWLLREADRRAKEVRESGG